MRIAFPNGLSAKTAAALVALCGYFSVVAAHAEPAATGGSWLNTAISPKQCPVSPINVPTPLLQTGSIQGLRSRIRIIGDTLWIAGTPSPDHIVVTAGSSPDTVSVVFNGQQLGVFGPVARVHVLGGDGGDVMIVDPSAGLPVRLEAGADASCLQGGSGADQLIGGAGDDVLIAGTGRSALDAGPGRNRVVVPRSMGMLWVTPSADVSVMRRVGTVYTLASPPDRGSPLQGPLIPLIVGPSDLQDADMIALVRQVYEAGQAVAITDATAGNAASLRALLGHPNAVDGIAPGERVEMVTFRKTPRPGTPAYDYRVAVFQQPADDGSLSAPPRRLDEYTTVLLSQSFSAMAIVPQAPSDVTASATASSVTPNGSSSNNLLQIADSYTASEINQNGNGDQAQIVNSIWNVRSFTNQTDYYYVLQEVDYRNGREQAALNPGTTNSEINSLSASPTLFQTSPQSTQCAVSTTSGVSYSIGGSAGWNFKQIANATVSGSVTISNSKTISCPQIKIINQSNPAGGRASWEYGSPFLAAGTLQTFYNQWIWAVPFTSYSAEQKAQAQVSISSEAEAKWFYFFGVSDVSVNLLSVVPIPFGNVFALQKPSVLFVTPACVNAGDSFVITGSGFYPSLVTSISIYGSPVNSGDYTVTSDNAISVVAPALSGYYLPVAVQTAQGLSNTNVTVSISTSHACS